MRSRLAVVLLAIAVSMTLCASPARSAASDVPLPSTTVSGVDSLWHNQPVTLIFTASDPGGPGIAYTEYSLDAGATWTQGNPVIIAAPSDHSNDGTHTVLYRSVDSAGNTETAKIATVLIDTSIPTAKLFASTVRAGRPARLRFRISDAAPSGAAANLTISITEKGRSRKTIRVSNAPTGKILSIGFHCAWTPGRYRWSLRATDLAGNTAKAVSAQLTVAPADRRVERAISWALAQRGAHSWDEGCLTFVNSAYQNAGVTPTRWYLAIQAARALGASSHKGVPPRGAYVFYWTPNGHVGLSLGDGRIVHDYGSAGVIVSNYRGISNAYIGWAIPKTTPQVHLGI
jgi:cell wall-associated NlpC family hydrolase